MRTTVDLDDKLLDRARKRARSEGKTLTAVIEEALAALLAPRPPGRGAYKLDWKPHRGRFLGGVDIADRDALHELMEGRG